VEPRSRNRAWIQCVNGVGAASLSAKVVLLCLNAVGVRISAALGDDALTD
jgi:hypothetical protein